MFAGIVCLENTVHYFHVMVGWQVDRQRVRLADSWIQRWINRETDRQTDRQTGRQTALLHRMGALRPTANKLV